MLIITWRFGNMRNLQSYLFSTISFFQIKKYWEKNSSLKRLTYYLTNIWLNKSMRTIALGRWPLAIERIQLFPALRGNYSGLLTSQTFNNCILSNVSQPIGIFESIILEYDIPLTHEKLCTTKFVLYSKNIV